MDVSKQKHLNMPVADSTPIKSDADPSGQELIQQLVSASGLPEAAVHQELEEICGVAGQDTGELTLDQLRAAMLTYLEKLEMEANAAEADAGHLS